MTNRTNIRIQTFLAPFSRPLLCGLFNQGVDLAQQNRVFDFDIFRPASIN